MKILLDTCTFLWIIEGSAELSKTARDMFTTPGNEVFMSSASVWEIIVKHRLGKLPLPEPADTFIPRCRAAHRITPLAIDESALLQLAKLPDYHRDPFDRILICQAINSGLTILTPDRHIVQYPVSTAW